MSDAVSFDGYTTYSDSSTPRTPSPRDDYHPASFSAKQPPQFSEDPDSYYRGGLLQELYEQDSPYTPEWQGQQHPHHPVHHQPAPPPQHYPMGMPRRNTFPSVRGDMPGQHYPPHFLPQHPPYPATYAEPNQHYLPPFHEDPSVKLEDTNSHMVPTQSPQAFYRPPSTGAESVHYMGPGPATYSPYLSPHTGLPVQHTDDAASKETQYLRRRCFNCHTTEPPSWRRSTLNPGKIVCNKCGLYERTHLRPRPLRFDELRNSNKGNRGKSGNSKAMAPQGSQSPIQGSPKVKKEPGSGNSLLRRASVSSNASMHSSNGANSDWDDNVSLYSSGSSAPPTSYNSPSPSSYSLQRDSQSPPATTGIRLPNNPLAELSQTTLHGSSPQASPHLLAMSPPRKSHSLPMSATYGHSSWMQQSPHLSVSLELPEEMMMSHGMGLHMDHLSVSPPPMSMLHDVSEGITV